MATMIIKSRGASILESCSCQECLKAICELKVLPAQRQKHLLALAETAFINPAGAFNLLPTFYFALKVS